MRNYELNPQSCKSVMNCYTTLLFQMCVSCVDPGHLADIFNICKFSSHIYTKKKNNNNNDLIWYYMNSRSFTLCLNS